MVLSVLLICVACGITQAADASSWQKVSVPKPTDARVRSVLFVSDTEIWVTLRKAGIRRSTDRGATWTDMTGGLAGEDVGAIGHAKDGTIVVGTGNSAAGSAYRRVQDRWVKSNLPYAALLLILRDTELLAYLGGRGIHAGSSDGSKWSVRGRPPASGIVQRVQVRPGRNDLFAGTEGNGCYWSTSGGAKWTFMGHKSGSANGPSNGAAFIFPANGDVLYAEHAAIYKWGGGTDGAQWDHVLTSIPSNHQVFSSFTAPDGTIFMGTGRAYAPGNSYVYVSTDNGVSAHLLSAQGLPADDRVTFLHLDSAGVLYAALRDSGLWRTSGPVSGAATASGATGR